MVSEEVLELERRFVDDSDEPTLFAAYRLLLPEWQNDRADRDKGLHLLFLVWYLLIEPPYLTGLVNETELRPSLTDTLVETHEQLRLAFAEDSEFLFTACVMIQHAPWLFGPTDAEVTQWSKIGDMYRQRFESRCQAGIERPKFDTTTAYGLYFAQMV